MPGSGTGPRVLFIKLSLNLVLNYSIPCILICGVSEHDRDSSIMRRLWPTEGYCAMVENKPDLSVLVN